MQTNQSITVLLAARDVLRATHASLTAPDVHQSVSAPVLPEQIQACLEQIDNALIAAQGEPKPSLADVNLDVIARSHEWCIDQYGNLFGLTPTDQQFEFTGITLDGEMLAIWKRGYIDPLRRISPLTPVATADEALAIARDNEQQLRWEFNLWKHGFIQANLPEQAKQISDFLQSLPLIPEVEPDHRAPTESGPWVYGYSANKDGDRHFIQSDDFTHDVRLYINGDFRDDAQRKAYGELVAAKLNTAFNATPVAKRSLFAEIEEGFKALAAQRTSQPGTTPVRECLEQLKSLMEARLFADTTRHSTIHDRNAMRFVHDTLANLLRSKPNQPQAPFSNPRRTGSQ